MLVIADDLSGAAEIAGLALRYGMSARVLRQPSSSVEADLVVFDTDSRSLNPSQAAAVVARFAQPLRPARFDLIYKKTDSALRGQALVEVRQLLDSFGFVRAILLPQNPSRGRTIVDGQYLINGTPLHLTTFANDPEHPAKSADVRDLVGSAVPSSIVKPLSAAPGDGVIVGEASSLEHVQCWAEQVDGETLPAGGADFFAAILGSRGKKPSVPFVEKLSGTRLFVCGSASTYSAQLIQSCLRCDISVLEMPRKVFEGADYQSWAARVRDELRATHAALIAINQPLDRKPLTAQRLQATLAEVVAHILARHRIDNLLLEGGATASAICRRMDWNCFDVSGELATGVVQLRVDSDRVGSIFIKPGSYPWTPCVWA